MQIQLNWNPPIKLGSSNKLRETIKNFNFSDIPDVAGLYIFYREKRNGKKEVLYVGQTTNIRKRFRQHCNTLSLVEGLEDTLQGCKMFAFSEIKIRANLKHALRQAERGYIHYLLDNNHPLLNKKLNFDKFDIISSNGSNIIDLIPEDLYVYSNRKS